METVLRVFHWLITIGLIVTVMLQPERSAGLGIAGGGDQAGPPAARRKKGFEALLAKITVYLAIAFVVTSIGLTIVRR